MAILGSLLTCLSKSDKPKFDILTMRHLEMLRKLFKNGFNPKCGSRGSIPMAPGGPPEAFEICG